MATSRAERWVALCCAALLSAAAAAAQVRSDDEVTIDGTMLVRAREARAHSVELSAKAGQWEFSGDVHIEVDGAILDSATAEIILKANRLDSAHVVGTPATFSHLLKGATQRSQGRALTMDYDADKSQLRLAGDVWYSDGRNDISTSTLNYNMNDRSIDSNPGAGERVLLHLQLESGATPATTPPAAGKK
jgi:lipopolysaccharide transport protein LptA